MKLTRYLRSREFWKETTGLAFTLFGVLCFQYSIAQAYFVPTGSMIPSLLPGDRFVVLKSAYDLRIPFSDVVIKQVGEPERGDIVVFKNPRDRKGVDFIKRLIGLPGDKVSVTNGFVQVNGHSISINPVWNKTITDADAQQLAQLGETSAIYYSESIDGKKPHLIQRIPRYQREESLSFTVPNDHYFFMGDNRDRSDDGRYWGFVPRADLKGKALLVYLSVDSEHSVIPEIRWSRSGQKL